jgi:hypothetical protein
MSRDGEDKNPLLSSVEQHSQGGPGGWSVVSL